jgi:Cu-Zn family superoxide dismutase
MIVMSRYRWFAAAALAVALTTPNALLADTAAAAMVAADGSAIGQVTFEQTPLGVLMYVEVAGLPPGAHGIHLHAVGACTPDFKAATGHINPDGVPHGLRHPDGPDHGDLPNLYVAADGSARAEFFTVLVSVAGGDLPALWAHRLWHHRAGPSGEAVQKLHRHA